MSDDRTIKNVFLVKPEGKRKAARPKLMWLDCIENDLKLMEEDSRRHLYGLSF